MNCFHSLHIMQDETLASKAQKGMDYCESKSNFRSENNVKFEMWR